MLEQALPCTPPDAAAPPDQGVRPVHGVRPAGLPAFLERLSPAQQAHLRDAGFAGKPLELAFLPGPDGIASAVFGLGEDRSPLLFGDLPFRLPPGLTWQLAPGDYDMDDAVLGYCLGAYRFRGFRPPPREPATLALSDAATRARSVAASIWMVRDLINTPANLLGPAELAETVIALARRHGADPFRVDGAILAREYPALAAVGAGSARAPVVAGFSWRGSRARDDSPLIALCGKGVVFDTGGYDIKPADGMLKMKKDMGGAAHVLGIARVLMEADLPLRLLVRVGCVENSISGTAMRPSDVIRTRRGLSVEVGNTDAEGRLVLADLLTEVCEARPALVLDCATLTGAARVALGPDIVAMFTGDATWAESLLDAGRNRHDPVWRLPLWDGYDAYLDSSVADLNNVSTKPFAGAVVAALFLRRFVARNISWVHLDMYAWNDANRPGRPEGGEAQALRAVCFAIENKLNEMKSDWNTAVT